MGLGSSSETCRASGGDPRSLPSEELVDDTAGGWFGIGLIRV
jgi:hypothetical protein